MISKKYIFSVLLAGGLATYAFADQIVLHDGKILNGTITDEDTDEVTILLAKQMVLRIEKTRIQSFSRSAPPVVEKPKTAPAAPLVPLLTPKVETKTERKALENSICFLTKNVALRPLSSRNPDFQDLPGDVSFAGQWSGVSRNQGSDVMWDSLVLESTVTAFFPQWTTVSPSAEDAVRWNAGIKELEKKLSAHLDVYADFELTASASLLSLRGASLSDLNIKSARAWSELLSRVDKKRKGLNRRFSSSVSHPHPK